MKHFLTAGFAALILTLGAAPDLAAQDLVVNNVRIIVGNGQVIESGSLVIRGGRITSIGAATAAPQGARAIDGRGMTAVPGFIDGHRHIIPGNADEYFKTRAAAHMQEFLEREKDLGTLETGKFADIVLLVGNPLEGYWHLLNARVVIKGGQVVVDKRSGS